MVDRIGETISRYRIVAQLGAGGMGVVYRAHDDALDRDLALKVLPPQLVADETARARLVREARTASSLNHPHIAHIYEVGEDHGRLFIAMELVEGRPLRDLIPTGGLPPEAVAQYAYQIADALAYAHQRGVIHRDLKTVNVMVGSDGRIKVLDFGLAKRIGEDAKVDGPRDLSLTASGMIMGTPNYFPPEVILGAKADARSDVWALGVVLYEMATGKLPFGGRSMVEVANAIVNATPNPISGRVATGLRAVIARCLAKEPADRYQQGSEVRDALEALAQGRGPRQARSGARRFLIPAGAILLVVVAAAVTIGVGGNRKRGATRETAKQISSLAVLPLANLSGDPGQEYFADGMTEELITDLASIPKLKVISRTSVMRFKNTKTPLRDVARELGVEGIVEGSVLRAGDRVRITAQLIEAASDRHLWARSYERDFRDVLALQSEVASDIAQEIQMQVDASGSGRLASQRQVNPEAYDLYLKGRYEWGKMTRESVSKGIEYFKKAQALDPGDARYSAGLADATIVLIQVLGMLSPQEGMPKVKEYARRALAADERSAEAHASMGAALFFGDWNREDSERHVKRSIELQPGYPTSHLIYSVILATSGRIGEGIEQDRIALRLDPLSLINNWNAAGTLCLARRYDDALAQTERTLQLDPKFPHAHGMLVRIHELKGDYQAAIEVLERHFPDSEGKTFVADVKRGYAASGREGYWRAVLARAMTHEHRPDSFRMAGVTAQLGDRERAIEYLERAYKERSSDMLFLNVDPTMDPLRGDPRFQALVRRLGLVPKA